MEKSVEIPQEIIDNVIAAVGDDTRLLRQCTLVSSSFLLPSRKRLFSRIVLKSDRTCQGVHQFLVQNPVIQSYVRAITLTEIITTEAFENWGSTGTLRSTDWMNCASLLAILRLPFFRLESFSINVVLGDGNPKPWNWKSFGTELNHAISNIIHSSNLKTLSLEGVMNVPTTFFLHIVHLTKLELHSVSPDDFRYDTSSLTWAASKGVAPTPPHVAIDHCMWYLEENFDYLSEHFPGPSRSMFLPFMSRLRFLEIFVNLGSATTHDYDILSFLTGSLSISLTSPATLERLKFDISFQGNRSNFDYDYFCEEFSDAGVWCHLDAITTHPTGSRLQRVDINVEYSFGRDDELEPDENDVLKAVLDGLPLLRSKDILFVKVISELLGGCASYVPGIMGGTGYCDGTV